MSAAAFSTQGILLMRLSFTDYEFWIDPHLMQVFPALFYRQKVEEVGTKEMGEGELNNQYFALYASSA